MRLGGNLDNFVRTNFVCTNFEVIFALYQPHFVGVEIPPSRPCRALVQLVHHLEGNDTLAFILDHVDFVVVDCDLAHAAPPSIATSSSRSCLTIENNADTRSCADIPLLIFLKAEYDPIVI